MIFFKEPKIASQTNEWYPALPNDIYLVIFVTYMYINESSPGQGQIPAVKQTFDNSRLIICKNTSNSNFTWIFLSDFIHSSRARAQMVLHYFQAGMKLEMCPMYIYPK